MLLLIDKPIGFTSFDVIKKLKRIRRGEKIGHAGTLDPNASGLLVVAIGKDTKRLHGLTGLDKSYETTIDFSQWSDTWDIDKRKWITSVKEENGNRSILSKEDQDHATKRGRDPSKKRVIPSLEEVETFCNSLLGITNIALTPFSAKKIRGKKLYEYAREGTPIHKKVPMNVINYKIIDYSFPILKIEFSVGSGTYIRSLGYVIGNNFGWGGILTTLRRTRVGDFSTDQLQ